VRAQADVRFGNNRKFRGVVASLSGPHAANSSNSAFASFRFLADFDGHLAQAKAPAGGRAAAGDDQACASVLAHVGLVLLRDGRPSNRGVPTGPSPQTVAVAAMLAVGANW